MQSASNSVKAAAVNLTERATDLATVAASYIGLTKPTAHSHAEEHLHISSLPSNATCSPIHTIDAEGVAVFKGKKVKHEVLVKINKLAVDDARHGLKEVASLDLVIEGRNKKGISYYHPLRYFTVTRAMGVDYIGEIEIDEGKCLHVRCHKAGPTADPTFHSIDTRPSEEGGAVFNTGEPLGWFDY